MNGEPGVDYPEAMTPVDILAASHGSVLLSFVERIEGDDLLLSVGEDRRRRPVRLDQGERLELVWRGPDELRSVPAELVAVEPGSEAPWRVRAVGPAGRGQRRAAVRAPMDYRVSLTADGRTFEAVSVDLSEGGVRCVLDDPALGAPGRAGTPDPQGAADGTSATATSDQRLEVGSIQQVTVWFDERENVTAKAEVIRHHPRADGWEEVSLRFIGLPEKMEDLIRGRVFSRLRDLRARGVL